MQIAFRNFSIVVFDSNIIIIYILVLSYILLASEFGIHNFWLLWFSEKNNLGVAIIVQYTLKEEKHTPHLNNQSTIITLYKNQKVNKLLYELRLGFIVSQNCQNIYNCCLGHQLSLMTFKLNSKSTIYFTLWTSFYILHPLR